MRRVSLLLLVVAVVVVSSQTDTSTPAVPNALAVFANGHYWPAVLRRTWRGTTPDKNVFGDAFAAAGGVWTAALCNADSDGDGFTNGEELGDPRCVWTTGLSTPPSRTVDISHPGVWSSIPDATYPGRAMKTAAAKCVAVALPTATTATERSALRTTVTAPKGLVGIPKPTMLVTVPVPGTDNFSASNIGTVCPQSQVGVVSWHDPSTWPTNTVPTPGTDVVLPLGKKVVIYGCSVPYAGFGRITVPETSELILADDTVNLRVKDIAVSGTLRIGSPSCPVHSPVTVTFTGLKSESSKYSNGMQITGNGRAELFGATSALTWTRLKATALAGSSVIVLQDAVEWSRYEEIVVTTSIWMDELDNQNEVRRIDAVDATNRTLIRLDRPLDFKHYGGQEYQCEVALLWRSILFRGDVTGYNDRYGGHTMAIGSKAVYRAVGVRAERMGQLNIMARYPFHMHMMYAGGVSSTFQQLACVHSYFRCFTVHGTNDTLLRKNVAFNSSGHTYYLEDGGEMNNTLEFNIAAYVHPIGRPAAGSSQGGEEFVEGDGAALPADHTASGFYIPNPWNRLRGNAASGGWAGFSFPVFDTCLKLSINLTVIPKAQPMQEFNGNTAHSSGYYWDAGGCVYNGGRLWVKSDGKLWYSNGRYSQPTRDGLSHSVTNLRAWLCQKGFSSWGDKVDISAYECHDCTRSAVLFGDSSVINMIHTASTENMPYDMEGVGRQGFQWYDTSVQTMLVNVTFRNLWTRQNDGIHNQNGVFIDLTHSSIYTPYGISATRNIRLENVDQTIIMKRRIRESSASRMFNFVDWDGSVTNNDSCTAHIIGSDISWWNIAPDCFYRSDWGNWVCPRTPGREVVGITLTLPGIQPKDDLDILTDDDNGDTLTQAQRDQLYIGHVSQFGVEGGTRRLIMTRNPRGPTLTGISGIGWYVHTTTGMPTSIMIEPAEFPRGTYILLGISYPKDTTFTVYSLNKWGTKKLLTWGRLSTRDAVVSSNGTAYAFDGKHLYLKISDMWSDYPNAFSRSGVNIQDPLNAAANIYVTAVCLTKLGANCAPAASPDPPADIGPLPVKVCKDLSELTTIPPLCTAGGVPYPSTDSRCTRAVPYPYTCSLNISCNSLEKPLARLDWCSQLNESPLNDECRIATCDTVTGKMSRVALPPGAACEGVSRTPGGSGACSTTSTCVLTPQYLVFPLQDGDRRTIRVRVNVTTGAVAGVDAYYMVAHSNTTFFIALASDGYGSSYSASGITQGDVARNVTIVVRGSGGGKTTFTDWADTAEANPSVKPLSINATHLTLRVTPLDHIGSITTDENRACDLLADHSVVCRLGVKSITIRMRHTGMTIGVTLPCLSSSAVVGSACTTMTIDVRAPGSPCFWQLIASSVSEYYVSFKPTAAVVGAPTIAAASLVGQGPLGADVIMASSSTSSSWSGKPDKGIKTAVTIAITLTNGVKETFQVSYPFPVKGDALKCLTGTYVSTVKAPVGVPGRCTNVLTCSTRASASPAPACPSGTLKPTCRACATATDCYSRAVSVALNADSTQCVCSCRNKWSGTSCSTCDITKYAGTDCDSCAAGLSGYPTCAVISLTTETEKCVTSCRAANCTNQTVSLASVGSYLCTCSSCAAAAAARVCALPSTTTGLTTKTYCGYPTTACQLSNGANVCIVSIGGVNKWNPCGPC